MKIHNASESSAPRAQARWRNVAIIGAGPAGLTAAYSLLKHGAGHHPIVIEESDQVGGIARTVVYKGYRFDIGGHRFFTKVKQVDALWREVLPEDFLRRPRLSRIHYRGKYYAYPLKVFNALANLGAYETLRILISYGRWQLRPCPDEQNFEQWITNRFGGRLFNHFFKSYTEKVWGISCKTIRAEWAAQRIRKLSLRNAIWNAISGAHDSASLIEAFDYPRLGPGMMWEAFRDRIEERGGEIRMNARAVRIHHKDNRIRAIDIEHLSDPEGGHDKRGYRLEADEFISSMPISSLVLAMVPPAPLAIQTAARQLKHRDFLIVTLILTGSDPFPDNWIYIHTPDVQVGRIQNFRTWSEDLVPEPDRSSIGMEYFCQQGDALWTMNDAALIRQATAEFDRLGLLNGAAVVDATVVRQPMAYPVYDDDYREALGMIRGWLANFRNLQTVGRNGMHRYNNQDHSMLTAMLAADNILGGRNDVWNVNLDPDYHEEFKAATGRRATRLIPQAA